MDVPITRKCPICHAPVKLFGEAARHIRACERLEELSLGERLGLTAAQLAAEEPIYTEQLASPEPPDAAEPPPRRFPWGR